MSGPTSPTPNKPRPPTQYTRTSTYVHARTHGRKPRYSPPPTHTHTYVCMHMGVHAGSSPTYTHRERGEEREREGGRKRERSGGKRSIATIATCGAAQQQDRDPFLRNGINLVEVKRPPEAERKTRRKGKKKNEAVRNLRERQLHSWCCVLFLACRGEVRRRKKHRQRNSFDEPMVPQCTQRCLHMWA
jgi:hypothetical protein